MRGEAPSQGRAPTDWRLVGNSRISARGPIRIEGRPEGRLAAKRRTCWAAGAVVRCLRSTRQRRCPRSSRGSVRDVGFTPMPCVASTLRC